MCLHAAGLLGACLPACIQCIESNGITTSWSLRSSLRSRCAVHPRSLWYPAPLSAQSNCHLKPRTIITRLTLPIRDKICRLNFVHIYKQSGDAAAQQSMHVLIVLVCNVDSASYSTSFTWGHSSHRYASKSEFL